MSRAFLLVLDSLGVGPAADAARYGDADANTLGHIAAAVDRLHVPHLDRIGLGAAAHAATNEWPRHFLRRDDFAGLYGCADERSSGKDTPSGHWEMAGLPVEFEWGTFPPDAPSFPSALIDALVRDADLDGVLGNCAMSGTTIIEQLGERHVATGRPIVYTSADSVLQIAAHEESFGLERLYAVCQIARRLVDDWNVGRVIARPFVGTVGAFKRTPNRRDYTTPPHGETLLDVLCAAGREVIAIGKIADIFAHRGVTQTVKAPDNDAVFDAVLHAVEHAPPGSLTFANFVDFDMLFGHRRDVGGYARALEAFDARLPELERHLRPGDLVILTADHGNDPTAAGTDHTRERVPIVGFGPGIFGRSIGVRPTFADIGQTVARHLNAGPLAHGAAIN